MAPLFTLGGALLLAEGGLAISETCCCCPEPECRVYWYDTYRDDDDIAIDLEYTGGCGFGRQTRVLVYSEQPEQPVCSICSVPNEPRVFESGVGETYRLAVLVVVDCNCKKNFDEVPKGGGPRQGGDSLDGETLPDDPDAPMQYVVVDCADYPAINNPPFDITEVAVCCGNEDDPACCDEPP